MARLGTFQDLSRDVLREFLSTVVVVDDRALLTPSTAATPRVLKVPGRQGAGKHDDADSGTRAGESAHELDGKVLTDAFAHMGVVCAVLKPEQNELDTFSETLTEIAANSDVVVLDWVLHEFKQGEKTLQLIDT